MRPVPHQRGSYALGLEVGLQLCVHNIYIYIYIYIIRFSLVFQNIYLVCQPAINTIKAAPRSPDGYRARGARGGMRALLCAHRRMEPFPEGGAHKSTGESLVTSGNMVPCEVRKYIPR